MAKMALAKGEPIAERELGKSALPISITGLPGLNMREEGFGVDCVWINIVLLCPAHNTNFKVISFQESGDKDYSFNIFDKPEKTQISVKLKMRQR